MANLYIEELESSEQQVVVFTRVEKKTINNRVILDPSKYSFSLLQNWYFNRFIYEKVDHPDALLARNELRSAAESLYGLILKDLPKSLTFDKIIVSGSSPLFHSINWEGMLGSMHNEQHRQSKAVTRMNGMPLRTELCSTTLDIKTVAVISPRPQAIDLPYLGIQKIVCEAFWGTRHTTVDVIRPGSLFALKAFFEQHAWIDILHVDAHGAMLSYTEYKTNFSDCYTSKVRPYTGKKFFLAFESLVDGAPTHYVDIEEFKQLLSISNVGFVFFSSCHSAGTNGDLSPGYGVLGETKFGSIGFSHAVRVDVASLFYDSLYKALLSGYTCTQSVLHSRNALIARFSRGKESYSWQLPVIHLKNDVKVTSENQDRTTEQVPSVTSTVFDNLVRLIDFEVLFKRRNLVLRGMQGFGKTSLGKYLEKWWNGTQTFLNVKYVDVSELSDLALESRETALILDNVMADSPLVIREILREWNEPVIVLTSDYQMDSDFIDHGDILELEDFFEVDSSILDELFSFSLYRSADLTMSLKDALLRTAGANFGTIKVLRDKVLRGQKEMPIQYYGLLKLEIPESCLGHAVEWLCDGMSSIEIASAALFAPYCGFISRQILSDSPHYGFENLYLNLGSDYWLLTNNLSSFIERAQSLGLISRPRVVTHSIDTIDGVANETFEFFEIHRFLTIRLRKEFGLQSLDTQDWIIWVCTKRLNVIHKAIANYDPTQREKPGFDRLKNALFDTYCFLFNLYQETEKYKFDFDILCIDNLYYLGKALKQQLITMEIIKDFYFKSKEKVILINGRKPGKEVRQIEEHHVLLSECLCHWSGHLTAIDQTDLKSFKVELDWAYEKLFLEDVNRLYKARLLEAFAEYDLVSHRYKKVIRLLKRAANLSNYEPEKDRLMSRANYFQLLHRSKRQSPKVLESVSSQVGHRPHEYTLKIFKYKRELSNIFSPHRGEAFEKLNQFLFDPEINTDELLVADINISLGFYLYSVRKYIEGEPYIRRGITGARASGDLDNEARAYYFFSFGLIKSLDFDAALAYVLRAITLAESFDVDDAFYIKRQPLIGLFKTQVFLIKLLKFMIGKPVLGFIALAYIHKRF